MLPSVLWQWKLRGGGGVKGGDREWGGGVGGGGRDVGLGGGGERVKLDLDSLLRTVCASVALRIPAINDRTRFH